MSFLIKNLGVWRHRPRQRTLVSQDVRYKREIEFHTRCNMTGLKDVKFSIKVDSFFPRLKNKNCRK